MINDPEICNVSKAVTTQVVQLDSTYKLQTRMSPRMRLTKIHAQTGLNPESEIDRKEYKVGRTIHYERGINKGQVPCKEVYHF